MKAIARAREFGLQVALIVGLVDREEGGREALEREAPLVTLFRRRDSCDEVRLESGLLLALAAGCASSTPLYVNFAESDRSNPRGGLRAGLHQLEPPRPRRWWSTRGR
jgi:hypothetical protein